MSRPPAIRDPRELRTLLVYHVGREEVFSFYESHIRKLREAGFSVEGFCITLDAPNSRLEFESLDRLWRRNDSRLMQRYAEMKKKADEADVLVLYNGSGLHPEFLAELDTFNAYMCFDDPESSECLSHPVARHFDASFVGNIASLEQYRSWGISNVFFRPLGFFETHVRPGLTSNSVLSAKKDIDACLFCERKSLWRRERIEMLEREIPGLYGRGRGWPLGWVSDDEVLDVYQRSKIGINLHNSTGPINLRTYALPANGVMQICDNKYFLGQIYELGREAVGYSEIEELPDLVNFYLANGDARTRIALAGFERARRDYNEVAVWERQMGQIAGLL